MESMFMGHFQNALNPYVVWRPKNEVQFLYTHTIGYSLPSFKRFLMTPLSARSTLVNFTLKKNLTSNSSKPIGILTRTKSWTSADHLPIGYLLPDFQLHRSNFFASALTRKEGGRHVGGAPPPPNPPVGGVEPKKLIWDDQSTGYLILSLFRAPFKFTDKSLEMDIKAFTLKNGFF